MSERKAKEIFFEAIEHDADLDAFLDAQCGEDQGLRRNVEELLAAHGKVGDFLGGDAETRSLPPALREQPGMSIGTYKLLQQIGEGGFGVVYLAEQSEPVRRKVALKIIKPGMDTKDVIARFEAERQALAMMDHPNIAKVLDGGTTESGRPYFVMELVRGIPLTEFCDKNRIGTEGRLRLFTSVCKAIQHAHNKGVIHRDIKPSNVMVTLHDGDPVPKVIDFGVAKAITSQLTEKTMFTAYGQMIGTPQYMSPEQAEMSGLDIDTRSDVYSLGVLLYELLTGTTPLTAESIRGKAYADMQRMIREDEAPRPSIRLSSLGDASASIAANRGSEIGKLGTLVRGELDWIVMKSLEKNRERRYETATSFAADVERFLHHEAVEACPPSLSYKLSKLARKHRKLLAVAASFAVLMSASSLAGWYLYIEAKEARQLAESSNDRIQAERDAALLAQQEAESARELAVQEKQNAEREQMRTVEAESKLTNQLYNHSIVLAAQAFNKNDFQRTRALLDESPVEHRRWEWHWLSRQVNARFEPMFRPEGDVVFNKFDYSPDGKQLVELTQDIGASTQLVLRDAKTLDEIWSIAIGPEVGPSWAPQFTASGNYILVQHADYSDDRQQQEETGIPMNGTIDEAALGRTLVHTDSGTVVHKFPTGMTLTDSADDTQLRFIPGGLGDREQISVETYRLSGPKAELAETATIQLPVKPEDFGPNAIYMRRFSDDLKFVLVIGRQNEAFAPVNVGCWSTEKSEFVWNKDLASPGENLGQREVLVGLDGANDILVVKPISVAPGEIVRRQIPAYRLKVETGKELSSFTCPLDDAKHHVMSRDGRFIVSSNSGRTTVIWDPATGEETGRYLNNSQISFKPTLRNNTLWTEAGRIKIDVETEPFELIGHAGRINSLSFEDSGNRLVSTAADDTLRIWDVERGRELSCTPTRLPGIARTNSGTVVYKSQRGLLVAPLEDPGDAVLLEDSRELQPVSVRNGRIIGMQRESIVIWQQESGKPTRRTELPVDELNPFREETKALLQGTSFDWVTAKAFGNAFGLSADASQAVVVGRRGKLIQCNLQTGDCMRKDFGLSASAAMRPPIFHPRDDQCVAIVDGRDIHFLHLAEERELMRLYGHPAVIVCTAFSPDGSRFYSIDRQGGLAVWNSSNGEQLLFVPDVVSSGEPAVAMAVSPNGRTLALADYDRIQLLEVDEVPTELAANRSLHRKAALVVNECHEQTRLTSRTLELIRDREGLPAAVRNEAVRVAQTRGDRCFESAIRGLGPRLREISELYKAGRTDEAAEIFLEMVDEAAWIGPGETIGDWNWRAVSLAGPWVNIDRSLGRGISSPEQLAALLERSTRLDPENHAPRFLQAEQFAKWTDWSKCQRKLSEAVERATEGSSYWHLYLGRLAILSLKLADLEQYRDACQSLVRVASESQEADVRASAALIGLLSSESGISSEQARQLLGDGKPDAEMSAVRSLACGLLAYRTDDYETAIECFRMTQMASVSLLADAVNFRGKTAVAPSWTSPKYEGWARASLTDLLRAMTYQKLGEEEKSKRFLSQADDQKFNDLPFMWPHRFQFEVMRQEAASVLGEVAEYDQTAYGWSVGERKPPYDRPYSARDDQVSRSGKASGVIVGDRRVRPNSGYSLSQRISADAYRGRRIQLKGFVRSERVLRFAGMWMLIEGSRESRPFDNMSGRPVRQTTDWTECSIVLDVPRDAVSIAFGGQLQGRGKFWMDDCALEVVDESVPTTGKELAPFEITDEQRERQLEFARTHYRDEPINLGFETPMRLLGLGLKTTGEQLMVTHVIPNSIAEDSGFEVGQLALAIGDEKVTNMRSFIDALHKDGPEKQVTIRDDSQERTIEVVFPY